MKFFVYLILILMLCSFCNCSLLGKLTKTFKNLFSKRKKIPREGEFNRENELEYPGRNKDLLREIRQLWNNYYDCLNRTVAGIGIHRSVMPEAKMVFLGSSVRLDCKVCISPAEEGYTREVTWLYKTYNMNEPKLIEYDENTLISPEDKMLHKYNVHLEDSGQFICKMGNTVTASYFLEVVNDTEPIVMVKPTTARNSTLHPAPAVTLPQYNLEVVTEWETWSPCSQCDIVGRRKRNGICTVRMRSNFIYSIENTTSDTSVTNMKNSSDGDTRTQNYTRFENKSLNLKNTDYGTTQRESNKVINTKILDLFKRGLPCRSRLLPQEIRTILQISERPSEIEVGFCKVPCPTSEIFEVRDQKGNVLEITNNTAGIYSSLQGIPTVPPAVQRTSVFGYTTMKKIVLKCPGNMNSETPVLWQIGAEHVSSSVLLLKSRGRMYIDLLNQMVIKNPKVADSNIYSCWQLKELVGTIKLSIIEKFQINATHPLALFGMIMISGTFLLVFIRAFSKRQR